LARPLIDESDGAAIRGVLESGWLTGGPRIVEFENALRMLTAARHAIALNSGTAALHLAVLGLDIPPGSRIAIPSVTFAATANVVLVSGHKVVLCDVDQAWQLDVETVPWDAIQAVIPVHYAGQALLEGDRLYELAGQHGVRVIEDAAPSLGAIGTKGLMDDRADAVCFSFHVAKPVTTGDGGALLTNDDRLAGRARSLAWHGIARHSEAPWRLDSNRAGYKYIMPEMAAALGLSQLQKLERFLAERRRLTRRYDELLQEADIVRPTTDVDRSACQIYPLSLRGRRKADEVIGGLREEGIETGVHYRPLHVQSLFAEEGKVRALPKADALSDDILSLPMFVGLSDEDQERVVSRLVRLLDG
jgi:perosamine synthetase